ncbi:MAG: leucine-rich repeat domain-containing protein, partial [Candidatus Poribacteria bacterium]|nr:leucine-rich repeat domain-containing protein [Candidatus Poribacteria bacterium]
MRNLILSTLSTLSLLIHPLSLSAQNSFSVSLEVDGSAGDQAVTSLNVSADQVIAIQIFATDIQNANGLAARFEYDANQVTYDGFDVGNVLPNAQALPEQGTNPTFVEIGIASLGGQATVNSGLVGTIRFRTTAAFSGTAIRLVRAELSRGGQFETITLNTRVELQFQAVTPDFDGDGRVGFADFLAFGNQFGARQGDGIYEAKYDLDSDGAIGFGDFLIFGRSFGQAVSTPSGGGGGEETQVTIPDANLRAAITARLGKANGASITRAEMATLTGLTAPKKDISDLTGLEIATGLTSLDISNNDISDISMLANLTNLRTLNLSVNFISDISPLANLINLTLLNLSNNAITDISPLSGLTKLTSLRLHDNFFSDISPLSGLTNLTLLSLYDDTTITDRSVLSRLSNLSEANIPDANLRAAIKIVMGKTPDDPITSFEMAFLPVLEAPNSNIRNLTGLELATSLKSLDLGIEWVSGEGYVNSNHISDLSPLSNLTNLTNLDLSRIDISDVSALSGLTNLAVLSLHNNSISDVSALSGLTNLTILYLGSNSISDVSALSGLTNLRRLYLFRNSISDVSALSALTRLSILNLSSNSISDVSALSNLTNLRRLSLENNNISDLSPLVANTGLGPCY